MKLYEKAILGLFIVFAGIETGAGLYEILVITPTIMHHVPDSLIQYSQLRIDYPDFAVNPGFKFWKFTSLPVLLSAIGTGIIGFRRRNGLLIISLLLVLICFITTLLYFAPLTGTIMDSAKSGISPAQVAEVAQTWVFWNKFRLVAYLIAWLMPVFVLIRKN